MSGSAPAGTARERGERVLAIAAVLARAGALVLLLVAFAEVSPGDRRFPPLAVIALLAVLETGWFVLRCLRTGVARVRWVAVDAATLVLALALPAAPAVVPGPAGQSVYFNFATMGCIVLGIPAWPLWVALCTAGLLAVVNVAAAMLPAHSTYPTWDSVPDALGMIGGAVIVWVLAALVRHAAVEHDRQHAAALTRAGDLARERERLRQAESLRARLLSTLDELVAGDLVSEPILAGQVRREATWLRGLVESGLPERSGGLLAGLRALAAEKSYAGLAVRLDLPEHEPALTALGRDALLGAVREALTNVTKHAGTGQARVLVIVVDGHALVEVVDEGHGYDPETTVRRLGQSGSIGQRMRDAGGAAEIRSGPGQGTRVALRLPLAPESS